MRRSVFVNSVRICFSCEQDPGDLRRLDITKMLGANDVTVEESGFAFFVTRVHNCAAFHEKLSHVRVAFIGGTD